MKLDDKIINAINTGVQNALNEKFGVIDVVEDIFDIFYEKFTDMLNKVNDSDKQLPDIKVEYKINGVLHTFIFKHDDDDVKTAAFILSQMDNTVHVIKYNKVTLGKESVAFFKEVFYHEIRHALDLTRNIKSAYQKKIENTVNDDIKKCYQTLAKYKRKALYNAYEYICGGNTYLNQHDEKNIYMLWLFDPNEHTAMLQSLPVVINNIYIKFENSLLYRTIISYYLKIFVNQIIKRKNIFSNIKQYHFMQCISSIGYAEATGTLCNIFNLLNYITYKNPINYHILTNNDIVSNSVIFFMLSLMLCLKYNCNVNDVYKLYIAYDNIYNNDNIRMQHMQMLEYYNKNIANQLNKKSNEYFEKYFKSVEKILCEYLYKYPFKKYVISSQKEFEEIKKIKMTDIGVNEQICHNELLCDYIDMDEIFDLSKIKNND